MNTYLHITADLGKYGHWIASLTTKQHNMATGSLLLQQNKIPQCIFSNTADPNIWDFLFGCRGNHSIDIKTRKILKASRNVHRNSDLDAPYIGSENSGGLR